MEDLSLSFFADVEDKLIAIEGIDGSGKSTLIDTFKGLQNSYKLFKDINFEFTKSPWEPNVIKYIRSILSEENKTPINIKNNVLLHAFTSDIILHSNVMSEDIADNKDRFYIIDRYIASTFAYQGINFEADEISKMFGKYVKVPKYTIYLKTSTKVALERINTRNNSSINKKHDVEIFDNEEYLNKINKNYDVFFKLLNETSGSKKIVYNIDTDNKTKDEVLKAFLTVLTDIVNREKNMRGLYGKI